MDRFRSLFAALLAASTATLAGCQVMEHRYEPEFHHSGWDPVLGSCDECGVCGGNCEGHTPGGYGGHVLTCASGCGEIYWGPWISDPPDECDPCDNCGNWIGPQCCGPKGLSRFASGLAGERLARKGKGKGKGKATHGGGVIIHSDDDVMEPQPDSAPLEEAPEPAAITRERTPSRATRVMRSILPRGVEIRSSRTER